MRGDVSTLPVRSVNWQLLRLKLSLPPSPDDQPIKGMEGKQNETGSFEKNADPTSSKNRFLHQPTHTPHNPGMLVDTSPEVRMDFMAALRGLKDLELGEAKPFS